MSQMKSIEDQAKAFSKFDAATDVGTDLGSYRQGLFEGFLAGYQAAKNQLADVGKVMDTCEHILDMEKMVDMTSPEKPDGWISVKERLPEMFHVYNHYRNSNCVLIVVIKESDQQTPIKPYVAAAHFAQFQSEKPMWTACRCSVSGNEVEPNEWSFEQVSHWMPLPKPPED